MWVSVLIIGTFKKFIFIIMNNLFGLLPCFILYDFFIPLVSFFVWFLLYRFVFFGIYLSYLEVCILFEILLVVTFKITNINLCFSKHPNSVFSAPDAPSPLLSRLSLNQFSSFTNLWNFGFRWWLFQDHILWYTSPLEIIFGVCI